MKGRILIIFLAGLVSVTAAGRLAYSAQVPRQQERENATAEPGGEYLRIETDHGPIHLWRPANYDPRTAGIVIYIHGYFTSVDQAWSDGNLATQFGDSGRNAVFIAVEAPQSSSEDVSWKSLTDLLRTVQDSVTFALPRGPLVVVGHSGAYRTILFWLFEPRVQHVILLDGLYSGQSEFRSWLRPRPPAKSHRLVLVSSDTWRQSNRFARRISGTARRRYVPTKSSSFVPSETHARLLYLRSQYDHSEIVSSGKVIPVLLEISPLKALPVVKAQSAEQSGAP
ncbi:MAG: hypothetical protein ACLQVG_00615 [Terriglobia bacterium]